VPFRRRLTKPQISMTRCTNCRERVPLHRMKRMTEGERVYNVCDACVRSLSMQSLMKGQVSPDIDELRMPIHPPPKVLKEADIPHPCRRRWFGLLPIRHLWREVRYTGKYSYQECEQMGCKAKRILQFHPGGNEPIPHGWENIEVKTVSQKEREYYVT